MTLAHHGKRARGLAITILEVFGTDALGLENLPPAARDSLARADLVAAPKRLLEHLRAHFAQADPPDDSVEAGDSVSCDGSVSRDPQISVPGASDGDAAGHAAAAPQRHAIPALIATDSPAMVLPCLRQSLQAGQRVVLLASGDPLWFGIGRLLLQEFGAEQLRFHPAPSSLQLAFARIGRPWQDARWVSLHGRDPEPLAAELQQIGRAHV